MSGTVLRCSRCKPWLDALASEKYLSYFSLDRKVDVLRYVAYGLSNRDGI
jgi:hypothetical protein